MTLRATSRILMIRPSAFHYNAQTAVNNFYQRDAGDLRALVQAKALREFDALVVQLRRVGIDVQVLHDDNRAPATPDSIFPNNWFVSLEPGVLVLCPMWAPGRRAERSRFLGDLVDALGHARLDVRDYTHHERAGRFLEGTGAMVLDRANRIAYCCLSPRADAGLFARFCSDFDFEPVAFRAFQDHAGQRAAIYHTNVMMAIGDTTCAICLDAIDDPSERRHVQARLEASGKQVIALGEAQISVFAGNQIELAGGDGARYAVMSAAAHACLAHGQLLAIGAAATPLAADVSTIEAYGGGSVRCMIAELC